MYQEASLRQSSGFKQREREKAVECCLCPWNILTALLVYLYRDCSNRSSAVSLHVEEVYIIQFTTPAKVAAMTVTLWCGNWSEGEGEHHSWCTFQSFTSASTWKQGRQRFTPVQILTKESPAYTASIADFWRATADDTTSGLLTQAVINGWSDTRNYCHPLLVDYWTYREEVSAENSQPKFPKDLQRSWPLTSSNFSLTAFLLLRITTVDC